VGTLIARGNGIDVPTIKVTHIFYRFVRKFIIMKMLVMNQSKLLYYTMDILVNRLLTYYRHYKQ